MTTIVTPCTWQRITIAVRSTTDENKRRHQIDEIINGGYRVIDRGTAPRTIGIDGAIYATANPGVTEDTVHAAFTVSTTGSLALPWGQVIPVRLSSASINQSSTELGRWNIKASFITVSPQETQASANEAGAQPIFPPPQPPDDAMARVIEEQFEIVPALRGASPSGAVRSAIPSASRLAYARSFANNSIGKLYAFRALLKNPFGGEIGNAIGTAQGVFTAIRTNLRPLDSTLNGDTMLILLNGFSLFPTRYTHGNRRATSPEDIRNEAIIAAAIDYGIVAGATDHLVANADQIGDIPSSASSELADALAAAWRRLGALLDYDVLASAAAYETAIVAEAWMRNASLQSTVQTLAITQQEPLAVFVHRIYGRERFGEAEKEIKRLNNLANQWFVSPGEVLTIPRPEVFLR